MGIIREGYWQCSYCNQRNRGPDTECASCGKARGVNVEFHLSEDAPAVIDENALAGALSGADWRCDHCGSDNKAYYSTCYTCSNERTSADTPRDVRDLPLSLNEEQLVDTVDSPPLITPRRWASLASAVCVFLFVLWWLFTPRPIVAHATGFSWERSIFTERYQTVREEGWSIPPGGRLVSSQQAIHHHERVFSHNETRTREVTEQVEVGRETVVTGHRDLGNGYFEDITEDVPIYKTQHRTDTYQEPIYVNEPVYRTRYIFDIERWVPDKTLKTEGQGKAPRWPEFQAMTTWRESKRDGVYVVYFLPESSTQPISYVAKSEAEWSSFQEGRRYVLSRNLIGIVSKVTPVSE